MVGCEDSMEPWCSYRSGCFMFNARMCVRLFCLVVPFVLGRSSTRWLNPSQYICSSTKYLHWHKKVFSFICNADEIYLPCSSTLCRFFSIFLVPQPSYFRISAGSIVLHNTHTRFCAVLKTIYLLDNRLEYCWTLQTVGFLTLSG